MVPSPTVSVVRFFLSCGVRLPLFIALTGALIPLGACLGDPAESAAKTEAETPLAAYQSAKKAWEKFSADVFAIREEYRKAPDAERKAVELRYDELIAHANEHRDRLRDAAVALFLSDPAPNADVDKTIALAVADELRRDNYAKVLEISKLLLEKGYGDAIIYNYAGQAAFGVNDFENAEKWLMKALEADKLDQSGHECSQMISTVKKKWEKEEATREKESAADDLPRVKLETKHGDILLELFENEAPGTVGNFISLVKKKYYDGVPFHRVLGNFMAQTGDPTGTGSGGPGYRIACECETKDRRDHFAGTLSMANAGPNTGGSQFFICFRPTPHLDGRHTVFGRVIDGFDVLSKIRRRDPSRPVPGEPDVLVKAVVVRDRGHEYKPNIVAKEPQE